MSPRLMIAGAHNPEILRLARAAVAPDGNAWEVVGFADDSDRYFGMDVYGVRVLARFDDLGPDGSFADCFVANNVGSEPRKRRAAAERLAARGVRFASLVHRHVDVRDAEIGEGTLVHQDAIVSAGAKIGGHCYINFGAQVTHDCSVGDYCILAPDAKLMARVRVGSNVMIGAGAVVIPDRAVASNCVIGALALVTADVEEGCTVVGNPGRIVFRRGPT